MPSLKWNSETWNKDYKWPALGDEWSEAWGNPAIQWYGTLFPRISPYVPARTILEIAPGYGRWTQFLVDNCEKLIIVDLSEECIKYCKKRFANYNHIEYHINDGKSLDIIENNSIDFIFSFDSLVHAELDIIEAYVKQFSKKLKAEGIGFVHHSNLGSYSDFFNLPPKPKSKTNNRFIKRIKRFLQEKEKPILDLQWRAQSVTYESFYEKCQENDLRCLTQELLNWANDPYYLIDCISVFCRKDAGWTTDYSIYRNENFMNEAAALKKIFQYYTLSKI